jgi:indolepyruvate ferredoxin oxidoreductase, beta subunit
VKKFDLLMCGVGGQGVVLASDIYGDAAIAAGYDVKKTDTLGMAQRGGSVISHVRIGPRVASPLIEDGEIDLILAFEKLEAARWSHLLRPGGTIVVNDHEQPPPSVSLGKEKYPSRKDIETILRQRTDRVYFMEGTRRARELGNVRTFNIYMLGCLSVLAPLHEDVWHESIARHLPAKLLDINLEAFQKGREETRVVGIE